MRAHHILLYPEEIGKRGVTEQGVGIYNCEGYRSGELVDKDVIHELATSQASIIRKLLNSGIAVELLGLGNFQR